MIILSNNVWNCDGNFIWWKEHGYDSSADERVKGLLKTYKSILPDIMGYQEMSNYMCNLLFNDIKEIKEDDKIIAKYSLIEGGYTPIIYRCDKLNLLESFHKEFDEFIPGLEGSFNDAKSKGFTCAVFEEKESMKKIVVSTTHLWWRLEESDNPAICQKGSNDARKFQINEVARKTEELSIKHNCPAIMMGDMNCDLSSDAIKSILSLGWMETHDLSIGERSEIKGLHYCYPDGWRHDPFGNYIDSIDHILIKNQNNTVVKSFSRFIEEYFDRISDHYPVYIDIEL